MGKADPEGETRTQAELWREAGELIPASEIGVYYDWMVLTLAISQVIWSLDDKVQLQPAELTNEKELEDLLAEHIEILNPDWLLIGRQVRTVAGKYIDLLCMDHDGDLVVVELKKDLTPREVTAQAIDYASCMADLTLEELAEQYLQFSGGQTTLNEAYEKSMVRYWTKPASTKMSKWLLSLPKWTIVPNGLFAI